jgi:hypothetical protein
MNGAAIKNGKFNGKLFKVNRGIRKGKLPIITCNNLREALLEKPNRVDAFPQKTMHAKT